MKTVNTAQVRQKNSFGGSVELLRILPKAYISFLTGFFVHAKRPKWFASILKYWFVNRYEVDLSEAELPIDQFSSLGELFVRSLKAGSRDIGEGLVSPIDGTLRQASKIDSDLNLTVKGRKLDVEQLLANSEMADRFKNGVSYNFYLSPKDYHRIHSPCDGNIIGMSHIPGKLWPVNDWAISSIDGLFSVNERVVTYIDSPDGLVAVVKVAAFNVGSIELAYYANKMDFRNWPWKHSSKLERTFETKIPISRGEEVGLFRMGSAVVLLLEKCPQGFTEIEHECAVSFGRSL